MKEYVMWVVLLASLYIGCGLLSPKAAPSEAQLLACVVADLEEQLPVATIVKDCGVTAAQIAIYLKTVKAAARYDGGRD